jgi:hypothetical protein
VLILLPLLGLLGVLVRTGQAQPSPVAAVTLTPAVVVWQPHVTYDSLVLTVSAPDGQVHRQEFDAGATVAFFAADDAGLPLPDGLYTYELRVIPVFDKALKNALAASRQTGDNTLSRELQQSGIVPREPLTQSGHFTISGGGILQPKATESE